MKNKKKTLHEPSNDNRSKKKYKVRMYETKEAEEQIKQFDRYAPIEDRENEDYKTIS